MHTGIYAVHLFEKPVHTLPCRINYRTKQWGMYKCSGRKPQNAPIQYIPNLAGNIEKLHAQAKNSIAYKIIAIITFQPDRAGIA
ncbi:MAG: hypothetical protein HGA46_04815 [Chlorobiaceae bacterium]|jgi:hypothetical protein|nr:hypothetical protein [Chlorobiaceae bacterium]